VAGRFRLWLEIAAGQAMDKVDVAGEGCGVNGVYRERERVAFYFILCFNKIIIKLF